MVLKWQWQRKGSILLLTLPGLEPWRTRLKGNTWAKEARVPARKKESVLLRQDFLADERKEIPALHVSYPQSALSHALPLCCSISVNFVLRSHGPALRNKKII